MLCNGILPSLIYTLSLHDALPISDRPLNTMYFPYIFVDAMYIKVREHNKVVPKAVYIATAINENNKRTVLGFKVDHVESYEAWRDFLSDLKGRGVQSPTLVISDGIG